MYPFAQLQDRLTTSQSNKKPCTRFKPANAPAATVLCPCIPLGQPDTEFEVVVVVQPKSLADTPRLPPGYFDLLGSIDDETFIIHPQPPLPPPVELE